MFVVFIFDQVLSKGEGNSWNPLKESQCFFSSILISDLSLILIPLSETFPYILYKVRVQTES